MHQEFAQLPDYDAETNQYNTLNRHYTPMGRWMSPDPGGVNVVKLDDPQTWNMYAYVRNNPTTLTDPTGLTDSVLQTLAICQASSNPNCSVTEPNQIANFESWKSLDSAQKGVLQDGFTTWNSMSATAQANFAAITHALETVTLGNGATALSEIQPGSRKDER